MNAKQSKKLRRKALELAVANNLSYLEYTFEQYQKYFTKLDGTVVPYRVYTCYMEDCQRRIYRSLKRGHFENR